MLVLLASTLLSQDIFLAPHVMWAKALGLRQLHAATALQASIAARLKQNGSDWLRYCRT
jgi:hypothetical protein